MTITAPELPSYHHHSPRMELRFVTPDKTSTQPPKLQFRTLKDSFATDWQDVPLVVLGSEDTVTVSVPPQKSLPPDMKAALISGVSELVDSTAKEPDAQPAGAIPTADPSGVHHGTFGPNDDGYLCLGARDVAKKLVLLTRLWSVGHYPHSNAKVMPDSHPLARALAALAELDKDICVFANEKHDPSLFAPYVPSIEAQPRWDKYAGEPGEKDTHQEELERDAQRWRAFVASFNVLEKGFNQSQREYYDDRIRSTKFSRDAGQKDEDKE